MPYLGLTRIYYIVTVNDRSSCLLALSLVGQTNKKEFFINQLPCIQDDCFHFVDVRLNGDRMLEFVRLEESFPINYRICLELERIVMSWFVPAHHRIAIGLSSHVLICPLSILCLVYCECLRHLFVLHFCHLQRILEVGKFVPVVVISPLFFDAHVLGL